MLGCEGGPGQSAVAAVSIDAVIKWQFWDL